MPIGYPCLIEDPGQYMSVAPNMPDWQTDCVRDAMSRLTARLGEGPVTNLMELARAQGQLVALESMLAGSDFFVEQIARHCDWLCTQLAEGGLLSERNWGPEDWDDALAKVLTEPLSETSVMAGLRRFRHQQMLRIFWRDTARLSSIDTSSSELSALADCSIRAALSFADVTLQKKHGTPVGKESGIPQSLVVLAMGKLGGEELNFSSDIDLIFAYPEAGMTEGGAQQLDNQSYFTRLGQMVIRLLDAVTEDGFVFRVDMRLRPYGDSGALVGAYSALEVYYQEQGREWERYAMIKARPVTGSPAARAALVGMLDAFVYRRYTDFSVIAALREMKAMMRAEVARLGIETDLKRGAGGIREIEFVAQSLQLIHGGRLTELRLRPLLNALPALSQAGIFPFEQAERLAVHYRLLRRVEHALQAMRDKQTQAIPDSPLERAQLALLAGFASWDILQARLVEARREVGSLFNDLIAEPASKVTKHGEVAKRGARITFADLNESSLSEMGFHRPEASWAALEGLLESAWIATLQPEGRRRLEGFLPLLCEAAATSRDPDQALIRSLPFIKAVCRRSAYLVLLQENPGALGHLLSLVAASTWIADRLASRPELLDELLHESTLYSAPSRDELQSLVRQQLLRIPEEDLEGQMSALSRIKEAVVLRVAASELTNTLPLMKVSDNLTFLAEVMIEQAVAVARAELVSRYGEPQGQSTGFAVMAYGKLGGLELSYGSDLDLVFVFDGAEGETAGPRVIDNTRFYTRLAQRVVHVLSARTHSGRLYEVDLRLRPDGESGLVATSFAGLRRYQLESAWVWEHQALVRARPVAGDVALRERLEALRREVLAVPREREALARTVCEMRARMRSELTAQKDNASRFDLKRDPGGIVDIEFVVQFLVLAHAGEYPSLTKWSDVIRLLEALEQKQLISPADASALSEAYLAYRGAIHVLTLEGLEPQVRDADYSSQRQQVRRVAESLLSGLESG